MKDKFELAAGSITGREHLRVGKNNQDGYYYISLDSATIAVVCDGCGSGIHSEVGAKVGSRLVAQAILNNLQDSLSPDFWQQVYQDLLHKLKDMAVVLGGELVETVREYLLFTIVGALITPTQTAIFAIGDGVFALNDQIIPLPSFPNNAPPYIAYGLIPDAVSNIQLSDCQFQIYRQLPTNEVNSILIGSDGVLDLMQVADKPLPGKSELVGEISQFWSDAYFQNGDRIRRRLSLINNSSIKPDWEQQCLRRENGLLADDTTMVVIRRKQV